ncbi:hypothetical protein PR048_006937 [Dryococelus australis]|uniref:Transposase n=1 Tax=Dryococelus australis TaxID=614101 RepID=A0ABQ9ICB1_9NEOP|nr:hypothetical protein PR048_006937 [Dryococelus australis]
MCYVDLLTTRKLVPAALVEQFQLLTLCCEKLCTNIFCTRTTYREFGHNSRMIFHLEQNSQWFLQCVANDSYFSRMIMFTDECTFSRDSVGIGRAGSLALPPRSPDLNYMGYFLWGHVKPQIPVTTVVDLIVTTISDVNDSPCTLVAVRQSMIRCCTLCTENSAGHFEHLLSKPCTLKS